jgi:hypothetical protein
VEFLLVRMISVEPQKLTIPCSIVRSTPTSWQISPLHLGPLGRLSKEIRKKNVLLLATRREGYPGFELLLSNIYFVSSTEKTSCVLQSTISV